MRPLFPFFGSKWRVAKLYGAPARDHVVEPFAGSAGYSIFWEPKRVTLIEADPIIAGLWSYLVRVTSAEILALPGLPAGARVDELGVCQEAQWLLGFWANKGSAQPKKTCSPWRNARPASCWGPEVRSRIALDVERIRHWRVVHSSYADFAPPAEPCTWFVDPPYAGQGRFYRFKKVDFAHLASWSQSRRGDVTVCENAGASWLPFEPLKTIKSTRGTSAEVVWRDAVHRGQQMRLGLAGGMR